MKRITRISLFALLLLTAGCSKHEGLTPEPAPVPTPGDKVVLRFRLPGNIAGTSRALTGEQADILAEEGDVHTLSYAVFQGNLCKHYETIDLSTIQQTGSEYVVTNLDKDMFDHTTEIFAVANASDELQATLFADPPPVVSIDDPVLQSIVADSIDMLARIAAINEVIIPNQVKDGKYPARNDQLYFKPADENNKLAIQYDLTAETTFANYAELIRKRSATTDPTVRAMYDAILEDMECRIVIWQNPRNIYNSRKTEYTDKEAADRAIATGLASDPAFTRWHLWRNCTYQEDLNATAAANPSRLIEKPLMAGYIALTGDIGSIITVPVEHVYCRIWFRFRFIGDAADAFPEDRQYIDINSITVEGAPVKTKLFNTSTSRIENNVDGAFPGPVQTIDAPKAPFFGDLAQTQPPYHQDAANFRFLPAFPSYNTVSRYAADGSTPRRYYVYAYQWGGGTLEDDPLITVSYSFTLKDNTEVTSKTTSARLYDETHTSAKSHHGLLRNYTYGVNCQVNANTMDIVLQAVPLSWDSSVVDDIPTFE